MHVKWKSISARRRASIACSDCEQIKSCQILCYCWQLYGKGGIGCRTIVASWLAWARKRAHGDCSSLCGLALAHPSHYQHCSAHPCTTKQQVSINHNSDLAVVCMNVYLLLLTGIQARCCAFCGLEAAWAIWTPAKLPTFSRMCWPLVAPAHRQRPP